MKKAKNQYVYRVHFKHATKGWIESKRIFTQKHHALPTMDGLKDQGLPHKLVEYELKPLKSYRYLEEEKKFIVNTEITELLYD